MLHILTDCNSCLSSEQLCYYSLIFVVLSAKAIFHFLQSPKPRTLFSFYKLCTLTYLIFINNSYFFFYYKTVRIQSTLLRTPPLNILNRLPNSSFFTNATKKHSKVPIYQRYIILFYIAKNNSREISLTAEPLQRYTQAHRSNRQTKNQSRALTKKKKQKQPGANYLKGYLIESLLSLIFIADTTFFQESHASPSKNHKKRSAQKSTNNQPYTAVKQPLGVIKSLIAATS